MKCNTYVLYFQNTERKYYTSFKWRPGRLLGLFQNLALVELPTLKVVAFPLPVLCDVFLSFLAGGVEFFSNRSWRSRSASPHSTRRQDSALSRSRCQRWRSCCFRRRGIRRRRHFSSFFLTSGTFLL